MEHEYDPEHDCQCGGCIDERDARYLVDDLGIDAGFLAYSRAAARIGMSKLAAILADDLAEVAREERDEEARDSAERREYEHAHRAGAL